MERVTVSEFADEYQDWLARDEPGARAAWLDLPIRDLGGHGVLTVSPTSTVREVVRAMCGRSYGAALVVEHGTLTGIFTERDLSLRVVCEGRDPDTTKVADVMTQQPESLLECDTLGQALRTLVLGGYRHVPVLDERGRAVHVVSVRRIVEQVAELYPDQVFNAPPQSQPSRPPRREGG